MMCHYEVRDPDVIIAGLLHDTVEDHALEVADRLATRPGPTTDRRTTRPGPTAGTAAPDAHLQARTSIHTANDAAFQAIEQQFGARVANLVAAVTNPVYDPTRDSDVQYREHLAVSLDACPWARVIKTSDFTDNGVGVIHTTGPKVRRAATKYRPMVPLLRELVERPDTPLSLWVKRHIFDQLDLAEERFNDILNDGDSAVASRT